MKSRRNKRIRSAEQFMREYFPKEYERRKAEGRCVLCGAPRHHPRAKK